MDSNLGLELLSSSLPSIFSREAELNEEKKYWLDVIKKKSQI